MFKNNYKSCKLAADLVTHSVIVYKKEMKIPAASFDWITIFVKIKIKSI